MSNQWSGESVFFSEYGSGNSLSNNYLELFNGTSSSIDLDNYKITIYRDNGLIYDLDLSGLDLDIGGTLLIVKGNTTTNKPFSALDNPVEGENYTLWNSINFFSGDDPIVLYHNDSIIDIIGVVNEDPGDGWFVDGVAQGTYKKTLIRKRDVISGSEDWSDSDDDWNVYDADTYYSIGKHADTFCDNFLNISTYDNVPPVVSLSTPQNEISAPSQIDISEDDSAAIDNDEDELSYQWSVVALDLNDNVIDDDLGIEIDNSTLLNQDSQTGFVPTLIIPGSALDDYLNGIKVLLSLTVSDSFNDPVIATKSYIVSPLNASPVIEVELDDFYICNSGCDDFDNYDPYNDGDDIYEDDYILIDASATYDLTDTGELNFDWSRYILDFDQNSVNDISYSFLGGDNAKFRIGVPQYLGEDKAISITLTVDDGDDNLADQIKVMSFNLKARKPIIGVISTTNNNFIYDDNEDKYVPQIGFLYEGYALELDGSLATTDPDGGCADGTSITEQECCVNNNSVWNVEGEFCTWNNDYILWNGIADLSFTWTASDSETSILGVCVDSNDEIEVDDGGFFIPCSNSNFCDNTCSLNEYIAYLETPIHLYTTEEKNKEFEVKMKVEDNGGSNGLESEESLLSVEVVSRYPFANAGNDFSVIAGGEFRLDAYLSEDNQESEVLLGSWNQSGNIWDGLSRNIMSNYFNSELIPFAYCDGLGEDDSNETIPVSVRCDDNSQCGAGGSCNPYIFEWSQTSPIDQYGNIIGDYILLPNPVNEGSPSFVAPADISESVDLHFILKVTDPNGNESLEDDIVVTIINNDSPAIDTGGDFRTHASIDIDKDGVLTNNSEDLLQLVYLDGSYSEDLTPTIDLSYEWTSATANLDYISSEEECTANLANWDGNICHLSLDNSDKIRASFIAPNIPFGQELDLSFTFKITEDDNEVIDEVVVTVARLSTPLSPNLSANAEHEKINLYWSNEPEATIDSLTLYADFQGYRIYKSDDYGKTWGNAALDSDGDTLGWYPYAIFDYNSTQDSTYCVYSAESSVDGTNCPLSEQRNSLVTGSDPFQFWFNLGDNSGLSNSFTDTSVIDGYDYMYTITSYDRGLLPPEFEYGSYNSSGDWISNEDFIFNEFMIANYYLENKLNFEIIESFICTNELISNNQCTEENKYYYHLNVPEGVSEGEAFAYKRQVNSSRNPDGYYVGIDNDGNKIGYRSLESTMFQEHNTELISSGDFADDIVFPDLNYIDDFLVPDCRAIGTGNKTYELVDLFALTGGFMKFEIQADLDNTPIFENYSTENACLYAYRVIPNQVENERLDYIPVEYQEDIDGNAVFSEIVFEDLKFDDDNGVYYYQESGLQYEFAPNEGESGEENAGEEGGGNCDGTGEDPNADDYICEVYDSESICRVDVDCDEDLDLDDALDFNNDGIIDSYDASDLHIWRIKPGVEINDINHTIRVPIYEVDCHELKASDTALPAYLENYFEVSGIRLRFDNILERPPNEGEIRSNILINDIYSYGIGDPDSSFIDIVTERQSYDDYSFFTLEFTSGASTKKPMYDYEIEFYEDFVDNSVSLGEDNCPNSGLSGTPLPFKVKNLTTGKYVGVKHNDNGIFGGKTPQSYINTYGSAFPDPGEKDCMWQPGETILFDEDIVSLASDEPQAQKTFAFTISYTGEMMVDNNRTSICSSLIYNNTFFSYSDAINYDQGTCIWHEGMVWYAKESISAGTHAPNKWEDENGSSYYSQIDNESSNPWKPVYLWNDETNVVVESEKWFVDGDFWIADMSKLGQLSSSGPKDKEIMVVPNPYMIYSNYNSQGEGIRFTGLPTQCTITIYTISGETVDIIDHDDMFLDWHRWDLKNNHGYDVAPGLYIYRLVDKNSSFEHIGKFAIIR